MSKSGFFVVALALAGLAGAAGFGYHATSRSDALPPATPELTVKAPVVMADKQNGDAASKEGSGLRVEAPQTEVNVDKERGKVHVRAPHTDVRIDPDKGRVRVRAPYVDLDIRW